MFLYHILQLQSAIRKRDDVKVQNLLGPIHDGAVIKVIDDKVRTGPRTTMKNMVHNLCHSAALAMIQTSLFYC